MSQPQQGPPPPHVQVLQMLIGRWVSSAISAAAKLDVAGHLAAGPKSIGELAELTKTHEPSLYRLLRALASVGIFTELEDGRFAQTPMSDSLRSDAQPGLRNMAMMFIEDWHAGSWRELAWSVETGKPAPFKVYGVGMFERFTQYPEEAVVFNAAMTDMSSADGPMVAAAYDFTQFASIVDVGGGLGLLLASILARAPKLRGTLFEMPYFIDRVRNSPHLAPYLDRCEFAPGSFFEAVPPSDAYIMKYIIHDWYDDKAGLILSNCRKGIRPGGKLLVVDQVVPGRNEPALSKLSDLEMLVLPGGMERTEAQFRSLFESAGWRLDRVIPTQGHLSILEGSPA